MRILLKGSRFESKRDSLEAGSIEELYGPPVAVPFKWEESPGKAKPVEKEPVLQIEGSHEFCNRFLTKEGSLGRSSGSLYKTVTHGNVPFHWEDEPGKPKTPARDDEFSMAPPLSPPPFLQSAGCTTPMCTVQRHSKATPKRFAKKMMKSIFQGMLLGVSKASLENNNNENSKHRSRESVNSFDSAGLGSDELGVSDSISRYASSSIKSSSVDDSSEFSNDEACRLSDAAPRCFARCPVPLPRNLSRSRNSVNDQRSSALDLKNAYISMVTCMGQSSKKNSIVVGDNEETLQQDGASEFQDSVVEKNSIVVGDNGESLQQDGGSEFQDSAVKKNSIVVGDNEESLQQDGGSEFQDAAVDFVAADESCEDHNNNNSNSSGHENSCCRPGEVNDETSAIRRANATVMEAELLRRLAHEDVKLRMVNRNFQSEIPGIFLACLPFCAVSPARRPKIQRNYEDPDHK